ncbi:unnamed protein product [Lactuca saligna]|uniref:Uncharacterized protein n=1 Tax=Lactuca saligna TaxID=75948 RepID=A0AA36A576_LACSI|nr:unnamed protein product [Lactuca saligna]
MSTLCLYITSMTISIKFKVQTESCPESSILELHLHLLQKGNPPPPPNWESGPKKRIDHSRTTVRNYVVTKLERNQEFHGGGTKVVVMAKIWWGTGYIASLPVMP